MIDEDWPVAPRSRDGSTTWSTALRISSEISAKRFGVGSPEILAEVETNGRPSLCTSCWQKSIIGIRIPTVPSSATVLNANKRRSGLGYCTDSALLPPAGAAEDDADTGDGPTTASG